MTTYGLTVAIFVALAGVFIVVAWMLYWLGGMYFSLRNGMNEIIQGLATIEANLERLAKKAEDESKT